jgi:hypothetical protein
MHTSFLQITVAIIYTSTEYGKGSDKFTVVFGWMRWWMMDEGDRGFPY